MEVDEALEDILSTRLQLVDRIALGLENYNAPTDEGLYLIITTRKGETLANTNYYKDLKENQDTIIYHDVSIDITSLTREAIERKEEVLMAVNSAYAIGLCEANGLKIYKVADLQNLSYIEGARGLKRYRIDFIVSQIKSKESNISYYENFNKQVEVE